MAWRVTLSNDDLVYRLVYMCYFAQMRYQVTAVKESQYQSNCFEKKTVLTHWGRDEMDAISQTPFSNAFSWMKMLEYRLKFQWNLFLRVQLTIFQHWFRLWLGAGQATSHYLNQWWSSLLTHICVSRPQWVNYSWSSISPNLKCQDRPHILPSWVSCGVSNEQKLKVTWRKAKNLGLVMNNKHQLGHGMKKSWKSGTCCKEMLFGASQFVSFGGDMCDIEWLAKMVNFRISLWIPVDTFFKEFMLIHYLKWYYSYAMMVLNCTTRLRWEFWLLNSSSLRDIAIILKDLNFQISYLE